MYITTTARIKTILRKARALIAKPKNWTTCASYRKVGGVESYCASGAITAATALCPSNLTSVERHNLTDRCAARSYLADAIGQIELTGWNDHPGRRHAEVLEAFDSAIGGLRAKALRGKVKPK